jgi:hypothetical protein
MRLPHLAADGLFQLVEVNFSQAGALCFAGNFQRHFE